MTTETVIHIVINLATYARVNLVSKQAIVICAMLSKFNEDQPNFGESDRLTSCTLSKPRCRVFESLERVSEPRRRVSEPRRRVFESRR